MGVGVVVYIMLLSLLGYAISDPAALPDCRKFVFAPICRGVAAKRGSPMKISNGFLIDAKKFNDLLTRYEDEGWQNGYAGSNGLQQIERIRQKDPDSSKDLQEY